MYKEIVHRISERFTFIENRFEETLPGDFENNEYEELVSEVDSLEEEVLNWIGECNEGYWEIKLLGLKNRIKKFKQDNEFSDSEDMLNMMFPNRQDDDYDEDEFSVEDFFDHD